MTSAFSYRSCIADLFDLAHYVSICVDIISQFCFIEPFYGCGSPLLRGRQMISYEIKELPEFLAQQCSGRFGVGAVYISSSLYDKFKIPKKIITKPIIQ